MALELNILLGSLYSTVPFAGDMSSLQMMAIREREVYILNVNITLTNFTVVASFSLWTHTETVTVRYKWTGTVIHTH